MCVCVCVCVFVGGKPEKRNSLDSVLESQTRFHQEFESVIHLLQNSSSNIRITLEDTSEQLHMKEANGCF